MASEPIPFAGGVLDRAGERRTDPDWLAAARSDSRARAVVAGRGGVLLSGELEFPAGDPWALPSGKDVRAALVALNGDDEPEAFLGVDDGGAPLFVRRPREGEQVIDLRAAAAVLPAADAGLLAYATTIVHWHRTHRFCGRCGKPTEVREGGHLRACADDHQIHPRTDPVVIMLVVDGDERVLLGRQPAWPARRYSALAGFVEPGETLETAVAREVREEAGIEVSDVRYRASQPWPFPASLMLGFEATWTGGEARPADAELESVCWFTREELQTALADERNPEAPLLLPPRLAIARRLVEGWLG